VLQVYQVGGALFILAVSFCSSVRLLSSLNLQSGQDQLIQWAGPMDQWARTSGSMGRIDGSMGKN